MAREPGERLSLLSTRRCPAKKTERWRERSSFSAQVSVFASPPFSRRRLRGRTRKLPWLAPQSVRRELLCWPTPVSSLSSRPETCPPRCWRRSLRSEERRMYCLFLGPTQDDKLWLVSGLYCTPHHRRERRDADFRRLQFRSLFDNPGSNPQVVTCDIPDKYRYSQPQARL